MSLAARTEIAQGASANQKRTNARTIEPRGRMMAEDARHCSNQLSSGSTSRDALAEVDIVVEAIAEDLAIKQDLFRDLDPGKLQGPSRVHDLVAADHRPRQRH